MYTTNKIIRAAFAMVMLTLVVGFVNASAQNAQTSPDLTISGKGQVHFNVPVKAGDTVLQPGMYQVQHVLEGSDHVIIFNKMDMPAGYRHSNTPVAKQPAARIKCAVEPASKKVRNTAITLRTNAAGEKEIADVQIAGELFRHLF